MQEKTKIEKNHEKYIRAKLRKADGLNTEKTKRTCFSCHKEFEALSPRQKFCTPSCRHKFLYPNDKEIPDFPETLKNVKRINVNFVLEQKTLDDFSEYLHSMNWAFEDFVQHQICLGALDWRNKKARDEMKEKIEKDLEIMRVFEYKTNQIIEGNNNDH